MAITAASTTTFAQRTDHEPHGRCRNCGAAAHCYGGTWSHVMADTAVHGLACTVAPEATCCGDHAMDTRLVGTEWVGMRSGRRLVTYPDRLTADCALANRRVDSIHPERQPKPVTVG